MLVRSENTRKQTAILHTIASIPSGCVTSYGEIAVRAGFPRCARLVGRILREAPESYTLPWHRVLRANGYIAFPVGSDAFRKQVRKLATEGIIVVGGRVNFKQYAWALNLDAIIWGPEAGGNSSVSVKIQKSPAK